ncbi:c6 finger domain protein [Ophiostoma piceae UAMH 11346]|uniref:C6 finger domain protein n=1 Tax=Ophiostoma piceae (strain UAMH 11346) TaxID=1262450 RepID=S3C2F9_OPHP1|nr:c6 finger domain protein [Ophiostoma piceae UAMH 11346]
MNFGSSNASGRHAAHGSISSVSSTPFMTPGTIQDMDMNMTGSTSNHGTPPGGGGGQRKERGAIAAQACDTCRSRKQKCDEQRPQCGTCQKFKLACHYREPQPTKKDKTLGEILDRLKTLESKIDQLSLSGSGPESGSGSRFGGSGASKYYGGSGASGTSGASTGLSALVTATSLEPAITATLSDLTDLAHLTATPDVFDGSIMKPGSMSAVPLTGPSGPTGIRQPSVSHGTGAIGYRYSPATYQMLGWPVVQQLLAPLEHHAVPQIKALAVEHEAQAFTLALHHETPAGSTPYSTFNAVPASISLSTPTPIPLPHWDTLYRTSNAYFDTFNCIAPIVDRTTFFAVTLPTVIENGAARSSHTRSSSSSSNTNTNIHSNSNSTASNEASRALAFLVLALGEVSMAETQGLGLHRQDTGQPPPPPPGLAFFNKARQLMGFVLGEISLEAIQIHALAGHFNIELGLPLTGLERSEHIVGLPDFSGPYSQDDHLANEALHFQEHYASQIVLRRLCAAFHTTLSTEVDAGLSRTSSIPQPSTPITPSAAGTSHTTADSVRSSSMSLPTPFPSAVRHMALQLDDWRGMLPQHLRWDDKPAQPQVQPQSQSQPHMFLGQYNEYSYSGGAVNTNYPRPYALDLQAGILRTRYYFTKYLVHKPFLYKALHYPDQLSHDDALGAAACLQACVRWPLTMAPTCMHKRLIPCVFFTTQNILGILIILRLAQQVPILIRIKGLVALGNDGASNSGGGSSHSSMTTEEFDRDAQETINQCIAWLRDLRGVDRAASWAWEVVKGIYHLREQA